MGDGLCGIDAVGTSMPLGVDVAHVDVADAVVACADGADVDVARVDMANVDVARVDVADMDVAHVDVAPLTWGLPTWTLGVDVAHVVLPLLRVDSPPPAPPISPRPAFLVSRHRWVRGDVDAAQVVVWHVVDVAWLMWNVVDVVWGAWSTWPAST